MEFEAPTRLSDRDVEKIAYAVSGSGRIGRRVALLGSCALLIGAVAGFGGSWALKANKSDVSAAVGKLSAVQAKDKDRTDKRIDRLEQLEAAQETALKDQATVLKHLDKHLGKLDDDILSLESRRWRRR